MNKTDAKKIVASLLGAYTNYRPPDINAAAIIWYETMKEYSYEQADAGLNLYMQSDTKGFPPVPGQIIDKIHTMTAPQELNEMEAWSLVSKAIRNSGYNSVEEFSKFPSLVQKAVGQPEQLRIWALDEEYNESVVSSNFMRAYRNEAARAHEISKMPKQVVAIIENAQIGSHKAQIEQKRHDAIERADKRIESENKAIGTIYKGVPMPTECREILEGMRYER